MGIKADFLPELFALFTQADRALDRSVGGLGIGLTLVRRLVELHGGSISASSDGIGKGSEFVLCLPTVSVPDDVLPSDMSATTAAPSALAHYRLVKPVTAKILQRVIRQFTKA